MGAVVQTRGGTSALHLSNSGHDPTAIPPLAAIGTLLIAGALAPIAFDLFGHGIAPSEGFAKLAPVGLAQTTLSKAFGSVPNDVADIMHKLTGMISIRYDIF